MKTAAKVMVLLLCAITMATVLGSCSKEGSYKTRIVGKWEATSAYKVNDDGSHDEHNYANGEMIWTFSSNGEMSIKDADGTTFGTYYITDNMLTITNMFPMTFEIQELTNDRLILHINTSAFGNVTYEFRKIK